MSRDGWGGVSRLAVACTLERPEWVDDLDADDLAPGPLRDLARLQRDRLGRGLAADRAAMLEADGCPRSLILDLAAADYSTTSFTRYVAELRQHRVRADLRRVVGGDATLDPNALRSAADRLSRAGRTTGTGAFLEGWGTFRDRATDDVPTIVDGLWPTGGLGFISAPPKAGKSWLALDLAISVATGVPFVGRFSIPEPRAVLYVALEGSRAGLRARIGALARGRGLDPDGADLDGLRFAYKPPGLDLTDPEWAGRLVAAAQEIDAGLVIVDVLRRAAAIPESGDGSAVFGAMLRHLDPLLGGDTALALVHHFGKLGETQKQRDPGDRMAGSGALRGALDVGLYITASTEGARDLYVQVEARDLAAPDSFRVRLTGQGSGPHGGFTYGDRITVTAGDDAPPTEADILAQQLRELRAAEPSITKTDAAAKLGTTRFRTDFTTAWEASETEPIEGVPGGGS